MMTIDSDMTAYFDLDNTLLIWDFPIERINETIRLERFGLVERVLPHYKHIEELKRHALRDHPVIIWSAGGVNWVKYVVELLELEKYVTLAIAKPQFWYDDLSAEEVLKKDNKIYHSLLTNKNFLKET